MGYRDAMVSAADGLRIVPLGGLGEIGMNCLALEQGDDVVVVDCGTSFPSDDYGVDVIHPDFSWLLERREKVRGVFLTHGHEDHIGALPFLLRDLNVPVYGPQHALRLCRIRLEQHGFSERDVELHEVAARRRVELGSFEFETIRVTHSIAQATALAIRTRAGTVLHSGDFKFDPKPSDGEPTDEARLSELGDEGVALLLSDSTNVDELGEAGSEFDVRERLLDRVDAADRRVFVVLFASNVQRLISLGHIAEQTGRRITALGTSLLRHIEIAHDIGLLRWPKGLVLPPERARTYPRKELLVLASGTQAEPGSAMWRLARGEHRFMNVEAGDDVIFSSRTIPGHERLVSTMRCQLLRLGARVEASRRAGIHTSGHACRAEQERMLRLVRPKAFVPVHGTLHHLRQHAKLAATTGVSVIQVVENGQSLMLNDGRLTRGGVVSAGEVRVGFGREVLDEDLLQRRRDLGRGGHLLVSASCDRAGRLLRLPGVGSIGVGLFDDDPEPGVRLAEALELAWPSFKASSLETRRKEARRFVGQWLEAEYRLRPVVSIALSPPGREAAS